MLTSRPASMFRSSVVHSRSAGKRARSVASSLVSSRISLLTAWRSTPLPDVRARAISAKCWRLAEHLLDQNLDRAPDHVLGRQAGCPCLAQQRAQRPKRLVDQRQSELVHAREVAVERRRNDAGGARDAPQADRLEALAGIHQPKRGVEQRPAGVLAPLGLRPLPVALRCVCVYVCSRPSCAPRHRDQFSS